MQGSDNAWYLTRNEKGEYSVAGSIFLDFRNNKNLADNFNIIYGHRMSQGRMFSDIAKFEDKDFFDVHASGKILLKDGEVKFKVLAFARIGIDSALYKLETRREAADGLDVVKKEAMHFREVDDIGRLFVLSTCNKDSKSIRDVLVISEYKH